MIRITEQHDWVIYCITGIFFTYTMLLKTLHRDLSFADFLAQSYEDTKNNFLSGALTIILFSLSFAVLFSQYIPIVPHEVVSNIEIPGYKINKIGFLFCSLLLFFSLRGILTYLFYNSIQQLDRIGSYVFVAQKFYMVYSVVILIMSLVLYYLPIDKHIFFIVNVLMAIFAFLLKIAIYLFHNQRILPKEWYYKFLYICTLQILPNLVIWKFWFF